MEAEVVHPLHEEDGVGQLREERRAIKGGIVEIGGVEAEGVGVTTTKSDPPKPIIIEPMKERLSYDIAIPITKPQLVHDIRKLSELKISALDPVFEQEELA